MELSEDIAGELLRCEDEAVQIARADYGVSAQAQYPAKFAEVVRRIERDCIADELGVRKPTVKDKL